GDVSVLVLVRATPVPHRSNGAAELVDPLDQLPGLRFELIGQRLDEVGAAERIGGVGPARLVRDQLLRSQRQPRRTFGRQRQRLVVAVRMDRLRASGYRGERLDGPLHAAFAGWL